MSEDTPLINRLISQRFCPLVTPESSETSESGGYAVQPPAAAPPCTKKLETITIRAMNANQKESMLIFGNAMSPAPIVSGIKKLAKVPMRNGITAKKIMKVACIVKAEL